MIVITAPTGNIGHQVLANVLAGDEPVRVIVRDPARLPAASATGSRSSRARTVTRGSPPAPCAAPTRCSGCCPRTTRRPASRRPIVGFTRPAAEAIRDQGVKRVVDVSALGRHTSYAGQAGHVTGSLAMDDLIASTGVAFRALTAPSFMDNMLRQVRAIKDQGMIFGTIAADRELPTVATRDIAAVAARLLLDHTWAGQQEVPLLGPEDLSGDDMAAIISEVLGVPVRYQQIAGQAFKDQLTGHGISDAMAQGMLDMMIAKDNGLDNGVSRGPASAIDTPTTFRQWCADTLKPAVQAV